MRNKMFNKLQPNLSLVIGEQGGRFPYSNGLMLDTELKVLVDTGFGRSRMDAIIEGGEVDVIINTHYHMDHVYGNKFFPNAQIWAHALDAPALRSSEQFMVYTGMQMNPFFPNPMYFPGGPPSRAVDRELVDGEILDFGEVSLQVVHTPGHTPGHIALYEPQMGVLFAGDIDLSPFGPWYGDASSNLEEFAGSINRLIDFNPKVLITGHRGIITDNIQERLREYSDQLDLRDEKILQHLHVPKTISDMVDMKIIYRRFPEPQKLYRFFEGVMIQKHLQRLMRQGKVFRNQDQTYKAYD